MKKYISDHTAESRFRRFTCYWTWEFKHIAYFSRRISLTILRKLIFRYHMPVITDYDKHKLKLNLNYDSFFHG